MSTKNNQNDHPFFTAEILSKISFCQNDHPFRDFAKKISSHQVWERRINQIWKFHKLNRNFVLHQIQSAKIPNYCQKLLAFVPKSCFDAKDAGYKMQRVEVELSSALN